MALQSYDRFQEWGGEEFLMLCILVFVSLSTSLFMIMRYPEELKGLEGEGDYLGIHLVIL